MHRKQILRILDQSHELISSVRIEGSSVYNTAGEKLGVLHSVMLNKQTGQAVYAVMLLESSTGVTATIHPLPWKILHYDRQKSAYFVNLSQDILAKAPRFALDDHDRPYEILEAELQDYYGAGFQEEGALPLPLEEGDFNAQPT